MFLGHFSFLKTVFHTIYIALPCPSPPEGQIIITFGEKTVRLMGFFWIGTTIPALQFNLQPLDPVHALQLIGLINDQKALFTKVLRRSFSNNRTTIHLHMPIRLNIDICKYINIYTLLPNVCHVLGCRYRARAFWLPIPREADT